MYNPYNSVIPPAVKTALVDSELHHIAQVCKDNDTCRIGRTHFSTMSSSRNRRFCIACFPQPATFGTSLKDSTLGRLQTTNGTSDFGFGTKRRNTTRWYLLEICLSADLFERRASGNKQRATSNEQRVTSYEQGAASNEQRAPISCAVTV